jgi:hypothetical protein
MDRRNEPPVLAAWPPPFTSSAGKFSCLRSGRYTRINGISCAKVEVSSNHLNQQERL